jgi:peptide/nickel transport system ATP-binding protein
VELLAALQADTGVAMLFVTHNMALVRTIAHEVAVMHAGQIVEAGLVESVMGDPQVGYTRTLLADTLSI